MTLADIELPMPFSQCRELALVYPHPVAVVLYDLQVAYGDQRHVSYGRLLTDGRWMMGGSILSEVGPSGIYAWITAHADATLMEQIDVVPLSEAEELLPPEGPSLPY